MGGKSKASAPPPDYSQVAAANKEAAQIAANTAKEQLAWAREQYASDREITKQYMDVMLPNMIDESAAAKSDRERYRDTFQPIEDKLLTEVNQYDTPQRRELDAGRAQSDVTQAFEAQRVAGLKSLESYGVDPSMARSGALDKSARVAQAAASAGAANASRLQTEATGRALRGEAINLGRGYQNQIAQAYATSQQAGSGAVSANLATTASGANTMGTATQWSGEQRGYLSNWGNNLAGQTGAYSAVQNANQQKGSSTGAIIGGIAGIAGAVLAPFTGGLSLAAGAAIAAGASQIK